MRGSRVCVCVLRMEGMRAVEGVMRKQNAMGGRGRAEKRQNMPKLADSVPPPLPPPYLDHTCVVSPEHTWTCTDTHSQTLFLYWALLLICVGGPYRQSGLLCALSLHTNVFAHIYGRTEELLCKTRSDPACWWWKTGSRAPVLVPEGQTWTRWFFILLLRLFHLHIHWINFGFNCYRIVAIYRSYL